MAAPARTSYRPAGRLDLASALAPYSGPWGMRQAAHLLRRAGFGGSPEDVAALAARPMRTAVDSLVTFADATALPDGPGLEPDTPVPQGPAPAQFGRVRRDNAIALQTWFLDRMIASPAPLQEKLTLFWHGHFTSAYVKAIPAQALAAQNELFRRNALGDVRELTRAVSQDPAMLRYLDNAQNFKAHPNENYARELMELFTLGIGNYSETDVREAARAFTGWTIDPRTWAFVDAPRIHDAGQKTLLGQTGALDGDDVVRIIFEQPAASRWFARKLLNFFVYNDPEPGLVEAVAELLRRHEFVLGPVLATLLSSNVFYSARAYRALVKSPIEFIVGAYQLYGMHSVDLAALGALRRMGQMPFFPPNVKGWDGGAAWLNSQAILTRANFAASLMQRAGAARWLAPALTSADPGAAARLVADAVLQSDVSPESIARLERVLAGGGTGAAVAFSPENAAERLRGAAYLAMAMPAFQLA